MSAFLNSDQCELLRNMMSYILEDGREFEDMIYSFQENFQDHVLCVSGKIEEIKDWDDIPNEYKPDFSGWAYGNAALLGD